MCYQRAHSIRGGTVKLYYNPLSSYSRKVLLAFEEKQQTFEHEIVDLFSAEAKAQYREINPLGKVPMLVLDLP